MRGLKAILFRAGYGLRRVVIIGTHTVAETLMHIFTHERRWGFVIVGHFDYFSPSLREKIKNLHPDELIFTDAKAYENQALNALEFAQENHIAFKYSADLFDTFTSNMSISTIAGIPIVELKRTPLEGWGAIAKRLFDIVFSSICIVLFSPLMLLIALAIKLDSKGPIFFVYERIGQYGKPFTYFKFRSMIDGAHTLRYDPEFRKQVKDVRGWTTKNPIVKYENDPRVTRVGKFLRKYSLDELAEFFLVLIGSMSLVGPRPHEKEEVEKYQKHHKKVLTLKPGMTGMAQISGRSSLSFDEEVRLDTFYIENWSLFLDGIIVIKTPFVVLKKDGIGT
jgi:exopolysaccharide biosynthesis polyprenyl glycosylphosphotransferase